MKVLKEQSAGPEVAAIQKRLDELGFSPGAIDGKFGPGTEAAVIAFQRSEGLLADGVVGPATLAALGVAETEVSVSIPSVIPGVSVDIVSRMFPGAPLDNIKKFLPSVLRALDEVGLTDKNCVLAALATIRAETAGFKPIDEFKSKFNTSPGGHPFNLYDNRKDLGNKGAPDGASFRGRGFVQLTGRANYTHFSAAIGLGDELVTDPKKANDAVIAAKLLAHFLKAKEIKLKTALLNGDLKAARRLVNGGSHGLAEFKAAYTTGQKLLVIPKAAAATA